MMTKEKAIITFKNFPLYNYYENQANVFSYFLACDARTGSLQKTIGTAYKPILAVGKKRIFTLYMNNEDCLRIANVILKKIETEEGWFAKATAEIYARAAALITFSRQLKEIKYNKKTNKELSELYKKFVELFKDMRIYSSIPTMLEHDTPVLSNLLNEKLRQHVPEQELNNVFSALTTPAKKSYLLQEELERLNIANDIKQGKEVTEKIKQHIKKWCWKEYMFEGTPLTEEDFKKEIQKDLAQYPNPQSRIDEIEKKHKKIIEQQQECYKKYNIPKEIQEFAAIAQDIVYLKYFRKSTFAESYYYVEFLLRKIGKRLDLSLDDIRAMLDYEVYDALEKNRVNKTEIQKRHEYVALLSANGRSYEITEKETKQILKENLRQKEELSELKGQVACSGKVTGKVCVINTKEELRKMQEGNILVSIMTNPNMFPAMKIAKGIITDVGGLSCHAAIVARELQIPCIVGTKNATKVLKEGMIVELDGEKGTITIIKE